MESIGKYTIYEVIGRGGMGVVYRARDPVIGRDVAIKVIAEHVASLPNVKERLYKEAMSAGRLSHENIMTIYDVGEKDGRPYLVMELLEGRDLRRLFDGGEGLSFDRKMDVAMQICRALAYAHDRNVVHRDIKPENVRVLANGRVKILDFGIARAESETRTLTHSSIGTPRYMSPEQIRGEEIDHRTDIFSFGVLLYELLTGVNPFDGSHVTAVIYKILHETPEPIRIDDEALSADLQRVVSRCLEKRAADRYPDFRAVAQDLEDVVALRSAGETIVVNPSDAGETRSPAPTGLRTGGRRHSALNGPDEPLPTEPSPEAPPSRMRRFAVVAASFVVVLAAAGYLFFMGEGAGAPDRTPPLEVAESGPVVDLTELREDALRLLDEVEAARLRAAQWATSEALRSLYQAAQDSESTAVAALDDESEASYRRAAAALLVARNTYEAVAAAGANDDQSELRSRTDEARRSALSARGAVEKRRNEQVVANDYADAQRFFALGEQRLEESNFAAAINYFGQAEAGFRSAQRALERADAEQLARRAEAARRAMDDERERVSRFGDEPEIRQAFRAAERLREDGIRLTDAGRLQEAASRFEEAKDAFAAIEEPVRESNDGAGAAAEASKPPPSKSPTEQVVDAVVPLLDDFKAGLENRDAAKLRSIHPTIGQWANMFDTAESISVEYSYANVGLSGNRASVTVTLNLTYKNTTQRMRTESQSVDLVWRLENSGDGRWSLREVTSP